MPHSELNGTDGGQQSRRQQRDRYQSGKQRGQRVGVRHGLEADARQPLDQQAADRSRADKHADLAAEPVHGCGAAELIGRSCLLDYDDQHLPGEAGAGAEQER